MVAGFALGMTAGPSMSYVLCPLMVIPGPQRGHVPGIVVAKEQATLPERGPPQGQREDLTER
jgi:hypothetical protein